VTRPTYCSTRPTYPSIVVAVALALAVAGLAVGAGVSMQEPAGPENIASFASPPPQDALQSELRSAAQERDRMADELAELRQTVDELRLELADTRATLQALPMLERSASGTPAMAPGAASSHAEAVPLGVSPVEGRLESAGLDRRTTSTLRDVIAKSRLDELYLQHQAERENWTRSELAEARKEQRAQVRAELGDRAYDYMLWAAGEPNRVLVRDVLPGSTAASLEIRRSDVILRYGGERVFGVDDLRTLTAQGTMGEPVQVEILRDGQTRTVEVPRGPLGVQIQPLGAQPGTEVP